VAVWLATQEAFAYAFLFILAGAVFDFFDGFAARRLGVSGPLGIQMDSLADDITFGLAPSMMLFCYLLPLIGWWSLISLLMAAFSALRLGKFNIDERQTSSFIGLPTPANALFWGGITSMPLSMTTPTAHIDWIPWLLLALSIVSCYLLVCELPMLSFKFHNLTWRDNSFRYIFLAGCAVILVFCIIRACQYDQPAFVLFSGTGCILWYTLYNLLLRFNPHQKE
jgi:CDP-diacylglycerol--serine O-phosphatidyltransferase